MTRLRTATALLAASLLGSTVRAQEPSPAPTPSPALADATELDPAEPDFSVITVPTNLRLPRHAMAFRLTHRFTRPLGDGDFGDLAGDFFGFDSSAAVGLELRFGLFASTQLGLYRTSDKTIEFFLQQDLLQQASRPVGLALQASVEGLDNFKEEKSPRVALIVSRKFGTRGAVYVVPAWVGNVNLGPERSGVDESSLMLGLGARMRVGPGVYLVGEANPRLTGYEAIRADGLTSAAQLSFGIEKQLGGHAFQINFSNAIGTTPAQVARAQDGQVQGWFIGFNLSRKFY